MRHSGRQGPSGGRSRRNERRDARRETSRPTDAGSPDGGDLDEAPDDDGDDGDSEAGLSDGDALDDSPLGAQGEALLEAVRPHLRAIGLALLGAVLVAAAWNFVSAQRAAARRESWDAYLAAINGSRIDALADVANRFPGTTAAAWSRLALAESALAEGTELAFVDKDGSRTRLESAAEQYASLLAERPVEMLAERATLGLAKAREGLGQLDDARNGYDALAKDHPASPLAAIAATHAAALESPRAKDWYGWFASWKPPVAAAPGADAATTPGVPPASGAGDAPASGAGAGPAPDGGAEPPRGE